MSALRRKTTTKTLTTHAATDLYTGDQTYYHDQSCAFDQCQRKTKQLLHGKENPSLSKSLGSLSKRYLYAWQPTWSFVMWATKYEMKICLKEEGEEAKQIEQERRQKGRGPSKLSIFLLLAISLLQIFCTTVLQSFHSSALSVIT